MYQFQVTGVSDSRGDVVSTHRLLDYLFLRSCHGLILTMMTTMSTVLLLMVMMEIMILMTICDAINYNDSKDDNE